LTKSIPKVTPERMINRFKNIEKFTYLNLTEALLNHWFKGGVRFVDLVKTMFLP
jgi:hypothetical protein